jgi:DNA/RNA endonuclease YhcR with UshA esterase domain
MLKISVDAVIQKIRAETNLSIEEVQNQIKAKVKELEGLVSEEGAAFIIAAELGVQVMRDSVTVAHKIAELKSGAKDIEIVAMVDRIFRTIDYVKTGIAKQVSSLQISDETGSIRLVMWEDKARMAADLKRGQKLRVRGAQVKLNTRDNIPELHVGKYSTLIILQDAVRQSAKTMKLSELQAGEIVSVLADVVQVREPKLYFVCPTCNKKVIPAPEGFLCPDHKKIIPKENIFCSYVLDDGTATIRAVAFGSTAEEFLGLKIEEIKAADAVELLERIQARLLGKTILIEGRVKENKNFSCLEIAAYSVNMAPNPKELAVKLMENL